MPDSAPSRPLRFVLPWHGIVIRIRPPPVLLLHQRKFGSAMTIVDCRRPRRRGSSHCRCGRVATAAISIDASNPNGLPLLIDGNPGQVVTQLSASP